MNRQRSPYLLFAILALGFSMLACSGKLDEIKAGGDKAKAEAVAWAVGKDQAACVTEALSRSQLEGEMDFVYQATNAVWLETCVGAAAPTAGLCDGVPGSSEIMPTVEWRTQQCSSRGFTDVGDQRCHRLLQGIQEHCAGKR